ncbi:MAG: BrnT family toxin [Rhodocyclaceae bacterium]|nr:BrnT family toxin [Rhodocyclaceae bacterium]
MAIEFDPAKDVSNVAKHGMSLVDFQGFDDDPLIIVDARKDYGETRYLGIGRIDGVGHCIVFTVRGGAMRLISFRRARDKEMRRYGR